MIAPSSYSSRWGKNRTRRRFRRLVDHEGAMRSGVDCRRPRSARSSEEIAVVSGFVRLSKSTELLASLGLSPESLSELANEQIALQSSASAPSFPGGSARRPQSSSSASVTRSTTDLGKPARPQTSSGEKPPVA